MDNLLSDWLRDCANQTFILDGEAFRLTSLNAVATKIERLEAVLQAGIAMRASQNAYFKHRTKEMLLEAKLDEAAFDRAVISAQAKGGRYACDCLIPCDVEGCPGWKSSQNP